MDKRLWMVVVTGTAMAMTPAEAPLRVAIEAPALLDLRDADAARLVPRDLRNPQAVEAVRKAWETLVAPLKAKNSIRVQLPLGDHRLAILLSACQALKAEHPDRRVYVCFQPDAPSLMDESAWGAVDGGALMPEDLGTDPTRWRDRLVQAQTQFPGRTWTLWLPLDPGAQAGVLLGDGGRLVVPAGGPTAQLAAQIPTHLVDIEGGFGDLTLRNRRSQEARRWRFDDQAWQPVPLPQERNEVAVVATDLYDVSALLARVRARQLQDRMQVQTVQAGVDFNLHFQGERGNADLGFAFQSFEQRGEPEELLRREVRFNGVAAKLHGDVMLPVVEARTSVAAPVALSLTERYRYSDGGPAGPGLRCIRFEPVDGDPLLYSGTLVVEERTGRIREERSGRSGLPGMVRSEDRTILYGEAAPGFWRILHTESAERWMGSGGVGQVLRTIHYRDFHFNDAGFTTARDQARRSDGSILRQTPEGLRYFVKQKDGTRKIEEKVTSSGRAIGGVLLVDPNNEWPVMPLAGLMLFDFNAFDRNIQYGLLTAGVFNHVNAAIPQVWKGLDVTAEATVSLLGGTERPVKEGRLLDKDGVQRRQQRLELGLARDLGAGFRIQVGGEAQYNQFGAPKEDRYATPGFVLPPSGWTRTAFGQLTWQGKGWHLRATRSEGRRPAGSYGAPEALEGIPQEGRFSYWGGAVAYDVELSQGFWLHTTLGHRQGSGLDRFQAIDFGGMVSGIKPHAVVADRLSYAATRLSIPTGPRLRLSLGLDHGRARSLDNGKTYGFTGLKVAGDLPGFWWFTTVRIDLGAGLQSDIPGVRSVNGMVSLLRLF